MTRYFAVRRARGPAWESSLDMKERTFRTEHAARGEPGATGGTTGRKR